MGGTTSGEQGSDGLHELKKARRQVKVRHVLVGMTRSEAGHGKRCPAALCVTTSHHKTIEEAASDQKEIERLLQVAFTHLPMKLGARRLWVVTVKGTMEDATSDETLRNPPIIADAPHP